MKIKNMKWRNIFSYGNREVSLDFDDEGTLWQLTGVSGAGKTSLLSIPKLLFFGKTEDDHGKPISVNDIANWTNKKGWIRGEVISGNDTYVIERTFSPSSLSVWKNGEQIDRAGKKDVQNTIDTEILKGMPYHIFTNLMTLSLNGGKSFISMTPADKREIIDKIFSLEIINKIYEYIKRDKKELGNAINIANGQIYSLENNIKMSEQKLNELKQNTDKSNEDKIKEYEAEIAKYDERIRKAIDLYNEQSQLKVKADETYQSAINGINAANVDLTKAKIEVNNIEAKIRLFDQNKCPTCGTPFTGDSFDKLREELHKEHDTAIHVRDDAQKVYDSFVKYKIESEQAVRQYADNMSKIFNKKAELERGKQSYVSALNMLRNSASASGEYAAITQIIEETRKNKEEVEKDVKVSSSKMGILEIMDKLYSSDGIKRVMMKDNLPLLNADITKTLQDIHFPYQLEFDDNFDPHIKHMGQEVKPQNLSTGEHKKIDAAVVCALLIFLKRRYPQINLICLDETVSSLDYESSSNIISKLKEIAKEMNIHIFIVSHTQLNESLFNKKITVVKNSGFSEITVG